MPNSSQSDRFLREPEVRRITGLSRSTRWRLERAGKFAKRRRLSPGAVGWLESEIQTWLAERAQVGEPGSWRQLGDVTAAIVDRIAARRKNEPPADDD